MISRTPCRWWCASPGRGALLAGGTIVVADLAACGQGTVQHATRPAGIHLVRVAGAAIGPRMRAFQGEGRVAVVIEAIGRAEAIQAVTARARASIGTVPELIAVRARVTLLAA